MSTENMEYVEELERKVDALREDIRSLEDQLDDENKRVSSLESTIEDLENETSLNDIAADNADDCRRSLFFALTELEEVERGEVSLSDKLFDLRMRHCRFL